MTPHQHKGSSMSIEQSDREAAAVAVAPRVTLQDLKASVAFEYGFTADKAVLAMGDHCPPELKVLSVCILVLRNGFVVIGKSAPASPENFDAALGERFAYEDAIRQLWPLAGYALRDRLLAERRADE
jgi:hypothetical protein